ncbi:stress response protein NST1-like [Bradysia coprophila]|uniref:stress response protein NST1-like n=1 Tax=Bradysia coprophila TaxID=38358 RepID=UPI00187DAB4C|nr:stress response protein NST1-like [Bradysia coprophila]
MRACYNLSRIRQIIPQNGSESERNSLVVISDQDIEIEYLDTTYEEFLEHVQIIEILNSSSNVTELGAVIEINDAKVESADASTATTTSKVQSAVGVSIYDASVPDNLNLETESIPCDDDDLDTATPLNDSDDEMSLNSTDEDATTDMIDATVPSDDFSHVPAGFPKYFQDSMFWPGRASVSSTSSTSKPKRKPKEKVPAVLISKDFIEYLKHKENEKLRLETEKADRQKQREVKKLEKQKQEEEKEKAMQERKLEKQRKEKEKEKVKLDKILEKQRKEEEKEKRKLEKQQNEEHKKKRKTEKQSAIKTRKIEKAKKEGRGTTD